MALETPRSRLGLRQINIPKQQIPLEQIVAAQGQNPVATGIETAGNVLGQVLQRKAELQRQGQEIAQLAKVTGQEAPTGMPGLDPATYLKALEVKSVMAKAQRPKPLPGGAITTKDGDIMQPFYNEQTGEMSYQKLPGANSKTTNSSKQFIGLDEQGNPLIIDSKSGQISKSPAPGGGSVLPKSASQATASTRSSGEFATSVLPHINQMRNLIQEADLKGYVGPTSGRIYSQFLAGKIGSTGDPDADQILGQLRSIDSFLKTGAMRVHFGSRGGQQMYEHFSDLLNSGKQSAALLNGSLDGIQSFMQGYADIGKQNPLRPLASPPATGMAQPTHRWNPATGKVEKL